MIDPLAQAFVDAAPALQRYAIYLAGRGQAADLVQDALLRGWEKRHLYQPRVGATLESWLCAIMRNRFISTCRRTRLERDLATMGPRWALERKACQASQFDEVYLAEIQRIADEIDASGVLPLRTTGMTYTDIEDQLGLPAGTVKSRIHRGRTILERMGA